MPTSAFAQVVSRLYFTATDNTVRSITPGGPSTTVATGFTSPDAITTGLDGNLYVSDGVAVLRVSPTSGLVTPYAVAPVALTGLAFGPDGSLYGSATSGLYRVPSGGGVASSFGSGVGYRRVDVDSQGRVYATQDQFNPFGNNGFLVRFTPAGAFDAQFPIGGGPSAGVGGVAVTPTDVVYAAFGQSYLRFTGGGGTPEVALMSMIRTAELAADLSGILYAYDQNSIRYLLPGQPLTNLQPYTGQQFGIARQITTAVPEPSTLALAFTAVGFGALLRRRAGAAVASLGRGSGPAAP
jgi:hypothetical protein